ncbi:hypothetical protein QBC34DRAFT_470322 [Podospora aff. communis PSN243]|uniref:Uncharacterized protein n=1 Tax=Podospora aff. communis PSN243 TaxID=3040156 RepID=A0AAV9GFJ9_9PEZI|nr:hypothetical protein QBC34DRAFT_470322 [Podospora aff. communis PSN243]
MRFAFLLLALPAAMAMANSEPVDLPADGAVEVRELLEGRNIVEGRACKYNGCKCDTTRKRKPQGQFCGGCRWPDGAYVITKKRDKTHVYECNKDGGCCDYGYAKDCGNNGRCGG